MHVCVQSRDEAVIKAHLQRFKPLELKVEEIRNREDLRSYLAQVARQYVKLDLTLGDIEVKLEREFEMVPGGLKGRLVELEEPIRKSRDCYDVVVQKLKLET